MKLIHLSDLHLGKRVNEFSMLDDQRYILDQILDIIDAERPDAVLIAGDVYDKAIPSAEAVSLFDAFLVSLSQRTLHTFVISGNHDSPERIAFGGRLMAQSGVHLSPVYDGKVSPITLSDAFGPVDFYLLPFLKPAHVRRFFPDCDILTYTDALVSLLALQTTMTAVFSDGTDLSMRALNAVTGFTVCAVTVAMGVWMIVRTNKPLKKLAESTQSKEATDCERP